MNQLSKYYSEKALSEKNPDYCNKLKGWDHGDYGISKERSIEECLSSYSIEHNDLELCLGLTMKGQYVQSRCLAAIAKLRKQVDLCKMIEYTPSRNDCLSGFLYK